MEAGTSKGRSRIRAAATLENLPYTLLGALALVSLLARAILILR